jgi:hypothetical protein
LDGLTSYAILAVNWLDFLQGKEYYTIRRLLVPKWNDPEIAGPKMEWMV